MRPRLSLDITRDKSVDLRSIVSTRPTFVMMYSIILIIMGLITISPVYERESQNKRKLLCRTTPEMASIFQMPPTFLFLIAFFYRGFPQMHYHIFICFLGNKFSRIESQFFYDVQIQNMNSIQERKVLRHMKCIKSQLK